MVKHNSASTLQPSSDKVQEINIDEIKVRTRTRSLNLAKVEELMESIARQGFTDPIEVRVAKKWGDTDDKEIALVAGLHRLEAMKRRDAKTIPAFVLPDDRRKAEMREISENLHRAELTPLEYDEHVAEWVHLIEEEDEQEEDKGISRQNVEKIRRGRPKGKISQAISKLPVKGKTDDAKRKNVERSMKVADIDSEAKEEAKKAGLDQERTALLKIAAEKTPAAQLIKARELAARKADKKKHSSPGGGRSKAQKPLSPAAKKSLQGLLKIWKKYLKAPFAKASSTVRSELIKEIQRAPSAAAERAGCGKK